MDTRLCQLCLLLHFDCFWWQTRAGHEPPFSCRPSHLSMKQLNMTCFCRWLLFCPHYFMESWFPATFWTVHGPASEDCSRHVCIWELSKSVSKTSQHMPCTQLLLAQGVDVLARENCATNRGCWVDWRLGASRGEELHYKEQTAGHDSWFQWA